MDERGYRTWAIVRTTFIGFHRWAEAPPGREYLSELHRHVFHVDARVETYHNDREIEFHDLLAEVQHALPASNSHLGRASCEDVGANLLKRMVAVYGVERSCMVSVFEDGENGVLLQYDGARPEPAEKMPPPRPRRPAPAKSVGRPEGRKVR